MKRFIEGADRGQSTLFPECVEDWIGEDNPVRVIDVLVDGLDLAELGLWRRRWDTTGTAIVIGKQYFARQAAILFGMAKTTTDPKISAALLDKAADLTLQVDEPGAPPDVAPIAPDIEPPPAR